MQPTVRSTRWTTTGAATNFTDPPWIWQPTDITAGPDGFVWFTNRQAHPHDPGSIDRIAAPVAPPTIVRVAPESGPVGTAVTITGTQGEATRIAFGGIPATVMSASADLIIVRVPAPSHHRGHLGHPPAGTKTSSKVFTVT